MTEAIKKRTKQIGIDIIKLVDLLPSKTASWILAKQIIRSATSIGANYRAACRAKSSPDFINKLKIVEEEADETIYWLEILEDTDLISQTHTKSIKAEINEIVSIIVASIKTARNNQQSKM